MVEGGSDIWPSVFMDVLVVASAHPQMYAALVIYGIGMLIALEEPRIFDLWITRVRNFSRVRKHAIGLCISFRF